MNSEVYLQRPIVHDSGSHIEFLNELLKYHKANGPFSLRQRAAQVGGCSQGLVSQILRGKRQLNRDNFPAVAEVFKLTKAEFQFIDSQLTARALKTAAFEIEVQAPKKRRPQNHLLSNWVHPYVKDLVNLKSFRAEPVVLFSMLKGMIPLHKVQRSVQFLLREGFWRVSADGKIIPEDEAVVTTHEIPHEKIRDFHAKALEIAARGLKTYPSHQRKASTVLISVNQEDTAELRELLDSFQQQLLQFIERHPSGQDSLVQVAIHLTPIGDCHD